MAQTAFGAILISAMILVIIFGFGYVQSQQVYVFGNNVNTKTIGTCALFVNFGAYGTNTSGAVLGNSYEVLLLNNVTYRVTITYGLGNGSLCTGVGGGVCYSQTYTPLLVSGNSKSNPSNFTPNPC